MEINKNRTFFGIDITWHNSTMTLHRSEEFVAEANEIISLKHEEMFDKKNNQHMMYVVTESKWGAKRGFFFDADHIQSNVREVDPSLKNLSQVLNWLLPSDYYCRQGDIGFYEINKIPYKATILMPGEYHDYFVKPFHKRHLVRPEKNCDFFIIDDKYYIHVKKDASVVHPEHYPAKLKPGYFEVLCAQGEPLPKIVGLKDEEQILEEEFEFID